MRKASFARSQWPHLYQSPRGYLAFVPPPLPPKLDPTFELLDATTKAASALSLLKGVGMRLKSPSLLIRPFIRREAVLSSKIEGTYTTFSELVLFEAIDGREQHGDVREVHNYVKVLEFALDPDRELPLSLRLLRDMHRILMTGVRGSEHRLTPGEFRRSQNWIGSAADTMPSEAPYVSPPEDRMPETLHALEKYLHEQADSFPALIRLALIHYQFEAIHPFLDGNGRVGRLLVSLLLVEWGLLDAPLLYLSAFFERRRDEYYERLLRVSTHAEWESWVIFFLEGVTEQSNDAVHRSQELLKLREVYHGRLQTARSSALPVKLVDALFEHPAITIPGAQHLLGVTYRAAQQNIGKLIDLGILTEAATPARPRVFFAPEINRLLQAG